MRVLILANNDVGLYKFRKELLQELIHPGSYIEGRKASPCKVFVTFPDGKYVYELQRIGCKFINTPMDRRGMNPFKDLKLLNQYRIILKKVKPDIVLTYTIKPNIYGGLLCRLKKYDYIPNVTGLGTSIENNTLMSNIILLLYKIGLCSAKTVFFQNAVNHSIFKQKKIVGNNGRIVPGSGVNLKEHCFEEYPIDDGRLRFLFIGRIMKDKGIGEFIECAEYIKKKYPYIEFDVLGDFDEEIFRPRIEELNRIGIIHYYGQQNDVHSFIKSHHATILPSYHEGLSNVLLETSAAGRPVIATNVAGCVETYDDGVSGIGFKPRSCEALINAVEKFIAIPYGQKKEMGIAARQKVENEFDKKIVVESYLDAIKTCIKK